MQLQRGYDRCRCHLLDMVVVVVAEVDVVAGALVVVATGRKQWTIKESWWYSIAVVSQCNVA